MGSGFGSGFGADDPADSSKSSAAESSLMLDSWPAAAGAGAGAASDVWVRMPIQMHACMRVWLQPGNDMYTSRAYTRLHIDAY